MSLTGSPDVGPPAADVAPGRRRKRRRPSGEPPPLPRDLRRTGRWWARVLGGVLVIWLLVAFVGLGMVIDRVDDALLHWVADLRTSWGNQLARDLQALSSDEVVAVLRWTALGGALIFRRFRHAVVFFGVILFTTWLGDVLALGFARARPYDVEILGYWSGFAHPSRPVIDLTVALLGIIYLLVPPGAWRQRAKWAVAAYVLIVVIDRVYLAVDHPTDVVFAVVIGVACSVLAYRTLVPVEVFPVGYGRGRAAHLDVTGRRGDALLRALTDQLGLDVVSVTPFALEGSAGSTPLKISLSDGRVLFGKLYAETHLRADRWYKLGRTLLYGRLEDEKAFSTVRRLVQYEDYLLLVMQDAGLPAPVPYGFVEITPEREYVLVTEFFEGAPEIGKVEVDDEVIESGLRLIRSLWDAGLAHRDIKPANLLVRDGQVLIIDVAFSQLRPTPWREAVDLANMMLVLALRTSPEQVYDHAVQIFSPAEISEAFAATRGLTLTSQLRSQMKADGRDLIGRFRELAPYSSPVRIQRWTIRRVGLTIAVALGALLVVSIIVGLFSGSRLL